MIHGLLEFVRERRTSRQRLTRPQPCHHLQRHLSQPRCHTQRRWPQHLLPQRPSCCPTEHLSQPAPGTTLVGLLSSAPSMGGRDVAHERSQHAQVVVGSKRRLSPSHLTIKAGPSCAEYLPTTSITSHSPAANMTPNRAHIQCESWLRQHTPPSSPQCVNERLSLILSNTSTAFGWWSYTPGSPCPKAVEERCHSSTTHSSCKA